MAETVYRSVKLVVQNSTNESLIIQGFATLTGEWDKSLRPVQGDEIGEQSAAEYLSQSTQIGSGVSGYVRFAAASGYYVISWDLPWTGKFQPELREPGDSRGIVRVDDTYPDRVVMMVTIIGD